MTAKDRCGTPPQALTSPSERIKMARAVAITGENERTLQAAAAGLIPGAAKPFKCWTFDLIEFCNHFKKPVPTAAVYDLNNLGSRGLSRERAMAHLGLSGEDFDLCLRLGRIPHPLTVSGLPVWPIQNLVIRNRRPKGDTGQYAGVYVIGFGEYVKIGMSANVAERLTAIQDWLPVKMTVHQVFVGEARNLELALHQRFSGYRLRGEWFRLEGQLAAWIETGCQ